MNRERMDKIFCGEKTRLNLSAGGPPVNLKLRIKIIETVGTQERLALLSGISEAQISRIIRGVRNPRPEEMRKIAHILRTHIEELFESATPIPSR